MFNSVSRRSFLTIGGAALAGTQIMASDDVAKKATNNFCLNTSTIRDNGKPRPLAELIEVTAKAGYGAIEPWIVELDEFRL